MKMNKRVFGTAILALLTAGPWAAVPGLAQPNYPDRPVKIVVPYPPGGASDIVARMIADKLSKTWGQAVIVDNKPGASGTIGAHAVARAPSDGYTILAHNSVLIQQPAVMDKLPYDPFKDLMPVVLTIKTNNLLAVPAESPAKTLREFVEMVKANPGQHNYGSYGTATAAHLHGELFKQQTGLDLTHIPFQGSAPIITSLRGNQITSAFIDIPSTLPHINWVRPLAIAGTKRVPELPDVPTFTELGYKSFEPMGWHGLFLPAGTSISIARKIATDVEKALALPDVAAKLKAIGVMPDGGSPDEFVQQIKTDAPIYAGIAKAANIRVLN